MQIICLLNCEVNSRESLLKKLRKKPQIKSAHGVFGAYEIIVTVECDDEKTMSAFISSEVRSLKQVRSMLSLTVTGNIATEENKQS